MSEYFDTIRRRATITGAGTPLVKFKNNLNFHLWNMAGGEDDGPRRAGLTSEDGRTYVTRADGVTKPYNSSLDTSTAPCAQGIPYLQITSNQMGINQSQLIRVVDSEGNLWLCPGAVITIPPPGGGTFVPTPGCVYGCGGGTYYSAESNENCDGNPTLTLTYQGNVTDTEEIAINAVTGAAGSYCCSFSCIWPDCYCFNTFGCSGAWGITSPCTGGCVALGNRVNGNTCTSAGLSEGYTDSRTPAQKAAGCCPYQLM